MSTRRAGVATALGDTLRMERRRVGSVRVTYLLTCLAITVGAVIALFVALLAPARTGLSPVRSTAALTAGGDALPLSVVGALMAMLGVATVGHDYRYGLLPAVLAAQPRRGVLLVGRAAVLAGVAAATAATTTVAGALVCLLTGRPPAHDAVTLRVVLMHVVVAALWAWLGAALTWALRGTAGAVSVLLLGPLLVEPLLVLAAGAGSGRAGTATDAALRLLPFAAARQALGRRWLPDGATVGALGGTAVFGGVTLALLALAWALLRRRDA